MYCKTIKDEFNKIALVEHFLFIFITLGRKKIIINTISLHNGIMYGCMLLIAKNYEYLLYISY